MATKQFEQTYLPTSVSPPGDTLAELLEEKGMTQNELAERCGRPVKTINEIIKAKTAITPETALQFERVLGTPAEFWNKREYRYREYLARKSENDKLKDHEAWLKKHPINEMIKSGWIKDFRKNKTQQIIELLNFRGIASPEQGDVDWEKTSLAVAFRRSKKCENTKEAISVWLRRGEIEAANIICQPYDEKLFKSALQEIRALTVESDPQKFIPKLVEMCRAVGVAVVFVPNIKGAPMSGATKWLNPDKALIQLSLRYKTDDHLWFNFFHEAAHILLHSKKQTFVDISNKEISEECELERQADDFASEILIPSKELNEWIKFNNVRSSEIVKDFAQSVGVSPGIVVGRLQHLEKIPRNFLNGLKVGYEWG